MHFRFVFQMFHMLPFLFFPYSSFVVGIPCDVSWFVQQFFLLSKYFLFRINAKKKCSCKNDWTINWPMDFSVNRFIPESIATNLPIFFGTAYGSITPSSSGTCVWPWQTTLTLKWSMSSLVTQYGAPITTSFTYWNWYQIYHLFEHNIPLSRHVDSSWFYLARKHT